MDYKETFWMACDSTEQLRAEYGPFHTRAEAEAEARRLGFSYLLRYEHMLDENEEIQEVRCIFIELPGAAVAEMNSISLPSFGCTNFDGYFSAGALPSRTSCRTAALSIPLTRNATQRAAFSIGRVKVIRSVFSFSTQLATTSRDFSRNAAVSGNKDAICPSGPMPSRIRSKRGNSPGLSAKNFRSVCS